MLRQLLVELNEQSLPQENNFSKRLKRDSAARFVELTGILEGALDGRRKIYVRDCMRDIIDKILKFFKGDSLWWLILSGTRGCGKSVVGYIVAILLTAQGTVVLYQHREKTMLMLSPNVSDADLNTLNSIISEFGIPLLERGTGVWHINPNRVAEFLPLFILRKNFVFIQDLGDQNNVHVPARDGFGKRLIVTSPNAEKLRHLESRASTCSIIMPTWKWEEIDLLDAKVPKQVVKERFVLIGGIPRPVLDARLGRTELRLQKQIENLSSEVLDAVFGSSAYLNLPSQVDNVDLLFRIEPKSEWKPSDQTDQEFEVVISSDEVRERLIENLAARSEDEILQFVSVIDKHDGLRELRGRVLEGVVHRAFGEHGAFHTMSMFKIDYASNRKQGLQNLSADQPVMRIVKHTPFKRVEDLSVEQGVYYYARGKNEETIDSFAVVDEGFIQRHFPGHPKLSPSKKSTRGTPTGEKKLFVMFFQITIAKSHKLNGTLLHKLQATIREKLHLSELPMLIVWISWSEGIETWQTVTQGGDEKKPFKDQGQFGPQYVLQLRGWLDQLARKYSERSISQG